LVDSHGADHNRRRLPQCSRGNCGETKVA
jgi:hypothetical protein